MMAMFVGAFCYQKLRKENGAVGTIVQSLAQLPDNEYTKGIIAKVFGVAATRALIGADSPQLMKNGSTANDNNNCFICY